MLGIVAVGVVRESRKFRAPIYMAHRAVFFATAQLSCFRFHRERLGGGDSRVVASRISKQEGPGSIPGGGKEV